MERWLRLSARCKKSANITNYCNTILSLAAKFWRVPSLSFTIQASLDTMGKCMRWRLVNKICTRYAHIVQQHLENAHSIWPRKSTIVCQNISLYLSTKIKFKKELKRIYFKSFLKRTDRIIEWMTCVFVINFTLCKSVIPTSHFYTFIYQ